MHIYCGARLTREAVSNAIVRAGSALRRTGGQATATKPRRPSHGDLRGGEAHDARVARHQLRHPQLGEHVAIMTLAAGAAVLRAIVAGTNCTPPSSSPESTTT